MAMLAAWMVWSSPIAWSLLCSLAAAAVLASTLLVAARAAMAKHHHAFFARSFRKRRRRVLLLGLDNAGKSSLCQHLEHLGPKGCCRRHPRPQHHVLHYECNLPSGESLDLIDPCGDWSRCLVIWKELLYSSPDAILFIVDAADRGRLDEAKKALQWVMQHPAVSDLPILILGNKVDLPPALETWELQRSLGLAGLSHTQREALLSSPLSAAKSIETELFLPKDIRRRLGGLHAEQAHCWLPPRRGDLRATPRTTDSRDVQSGEGLDSGSQPEVARDFEQGQRQRSFVFEQLQPSEDAEMQST
jgi:hypothetical protein